jgi:hypothetical protein
MGPHDDRSPGRQALEAVITLRALAEYQAGAVVNRTLVRKEMGRVTVFAGGAGEGLSEHTAPYGARVQVVRGTPRSPSLAWPTGWPPAISCGSPPAGLTRSRRNSR